MVFSVMLWMPSWNGVITFGALYFLTPRLWNRDRLYSLSMVCRHFWLATIGIVLYASAMWVSGIMEGLMWREVGANGFLVNAFADTVAAKFPLNFVRGIGGITYRSGAVIMCVNLWKTVTSVGTEASVASVAIPAE
jgi:cytochrome c oxidase cbb3-type subunit I